MPKGEAPHYSSADKLAGKVALVTGGDSGIGRRDILRRRERMPQQLVSAYEIQIIDEVDEKQCHSRIVGCVTM